MLRRTQTSEFNGKPILNLPPKHLIVVVCDFDDRERAFYEVLQTKFSGIVGRLIKKQRTSTSYISILTLLVRLRQG
jgi:SNF2 family DNA or RNA helicase